jgi:hypothetical protein
MMDSLRSERKTASRRYTEGEQCTRVFEIDGYSLQKELVDAYGFIESATSPPVVMSGALRSILKGPKMVTWTVQASYSGW